MKKFLAMLFVMTMLLSAAALADEVLLPDPGYYFGRSYDGYMIWFDEYPEAEFAAYTALLIESYGMEITDSHESEYEKFYFMRKPGVADSKIFVSCIDWGDGSYSMEFTFGKAITLSALDVFTGSAECSICSGDGVCDTCGGKGYLEMIAYGSKDTVRVACTGDCADGKCPACSTGSSNPGLANNAAAYIPPIVGNDGLLVMSPEQYLEIGPCDRLTISDDACYVYHYFDCGKEWSGDGSNEKWAMLESYVQALVDSGYYEVSDYEQDSYATIWRLRYVGLTEIVTGAFDIQVKSYGGNCSVYYRQVNITPDDLNEKLVYFGMDVSDDDPDHNSSSILEPCDACGGDGDCSYCDGRGHRLGDKDEDCSVCFNGECWKCRGSGHK